MLVSLSLRVFVFNLVEVLKEVQLCKRSAISALLEFVGLKGKLIAPLPTFS